MRGAHKFRDNNWRTSITIGGISYHLGIFITEEAAAKAYNKAKEDFKTNRLLPSGEYLPTVEKVQSKKPAEKLKAKERMLLHRYNLTQEDYYRMYEGQNRQCAICEKELELGGRKGLYVDHCHSSGKVRGLLCPSCNSAIGQLKDDIGLLNKAINYILKHQT